MLKKTRIVGGCCAVLVLVTAGSGKGDETAQPTFLEITTADKVLGRRQYLSSGGLVYHATDDVKLEPLLGFGDDIQHRDISLFARESAHSITAQAGGRISILDGIYASAAVKYPLYSFQSSGTAPSGGATAGRGGLEITSPTGSTLTWTGEIGTALGMGFRSYLYYDKISTPLMGSAAGRYEDRIGIRFQLNFK